MRMLLLFLPKPLDHPIKLAATLLGDLGLLLAYFLNNGVDIHDDDSYSIGSSMSSSGEQITGNDKYNRRFKTSI